jgi:hypothetical protein
MESKILQISILPINESVYARFYFENRKLQMPTSQPEGI